MKKLVLIIIALCSFAPLFASHIRGGEMYYKYIGPGVAAGSSQYEVTLKLYIRCDATEAQKDATEPFTIFDNSTNAQYGVSSATAPLTSQQQISYDPSSNPCITNPPTDICYLERFYSTTIEVPDNAAGYTIAFQRCCRIAGIENLVPPSDSYGVTYTCVIPGTSVLPLPEHNSSPVISGNDAVAICVGSYFTFDFSAQDPDGDSLVYTLCNAYSGGGTGDPDPNPSAAPPFNSLNYESPFSGSSPLGAQVTINPSTGIITGIAPGISAQYVVTTCIYEYRHGVLIDIHRKDIHLRIADCTPLKAVLNPDYDYCDDFLAHFQNEQTNPAGTVYIWQFGDGSGPDTSNDAVGKLQHQYLDTGTYTVKLKVILAGQCTDSTTTLAKVYPGFYPGFISNGSCILNAIQFTDTSKVRYGSVSAWHWNFGDLTNPGDTSLLQDPSWKYNDTGSKKVTLIVQSNKGCIDTVSGTVAVLDKPVITLPFRDTLICSNATTQDTLQLHATGFGLFSWTPVNARTLNNNTPDPLVFPTTTTEYYVQLDENGCINNDSVKVRVVATVTVDAGPDSTICLTDGVVLSPGGDGLSFNWSPAATLDNPNTKFPVATPTGNTTYQVIAHIGKCSTPGTVDIRTIPYPGSNAGPDQIICYKDTTQLNGRIKGSSFSWTPSYGLSSTSILDPLANPLQTVAYVLRVYDTLGCPKPGLDTIVVTVRPPVIAFAGNDTSAVVNQPVQLHASGAQFFLWTPATNLNHNDIQSPTATFSVSGYYTYAVKVYTADGCFAVDTVNVRVFQTGPDIFVPSAFTPGGATNTLFRPIPVGIQVIEYFRVYNRWGELMWNGAGESLGWDGNYKGKPQDPDTYVWVVQGKDFTGKTINRKGTMILIR